MTDEHHHEAKPEDPAPTDDEWENRMLCSDESCIGVVGPDGRCKECGRPHPDFDTAGRDADGGPQEPTAVPESGEEPENAAETEGAGEAASGEADPVEDDDWANRKLCSDGNCIGVIGPDGRCKECGKPYVGDAEETG